MATAFKEWAIVCDALASGRQILILRKGGIAEGREGFRFKHESFLLFPTRFHEQVAHTVLPPGTPIPEVAGEGKIRITHRADVVWAQLVENLDTALALSAQHILAEQVVRDRFEYDEPRGINIAVVRVCRLSRPLVFEDAPKYGGCRSWVEVPALDAETEAMPVLGEDEFRARLEELRRTGLPV